MLINQQCNHIRPSATLPRNYAPGCCEGPLLSPWDRSWVSGTGNPPLPFPSTPSPPPRIDFYSPPSHASPPIHPSQDKDRTCLFPSTPLPPAPPFLLPSSLLATPYNLQPGHDPTHHRHYHSTTTLNNRLHSSPPLPESPPPTLLHSSSRLKFTVPLFLDSLYIGSIRDAPLRLPLQQNRQRLWHTPLTTTPSLRYGPTAIDRPYVDYASWSTSAGIYRCRTSL